MRFLKLLLLAPLAFLLRLLTWPLKLRAKRRALEPDGWAELWLEGEVLELQPIEKRAQEVLRKLLKRSTGPRVVLSRLRKFVDAFVDDERAKGVLVRLGPLGGGWASADEIRKQLLRIQRAGHEVLVFADPGVGNKEMLVASAGTRMLMPPSGGLGATGVAARGLYLRDSLEKAGVKVEVASVGKFKSAPEQFTRHDRSESDAEQTSAIVRSLDDALVRGLVEGGRFDEESAREMIDACPVVGTHAHERGFVQGLAREENLVEEVQTVGGFESAPKLVGAGGYLDAQTIRPIVRRRRPKVGVVEVHGAIVDQAPGLNPGGQRAAVKQAVVDDLRAALADKEIGAVVLHVNSPGGSVTASDSIWAAVRRVDQEKPVIACFGDIAASGGFYVAAGARSIVASPLTVTGSIGVFAMIPTWAELGRRLSVGTDTIAQFANADLYDPWRGFDERGKAHVQTEVEAMYDSFVELVAEARRLPKEAVHEVAQGRVWLGEAAQQGGLLDGLGGMNEAVERAKEEAGGVFAADPVLVRAMRHRTRPQPFGAEPAKAGATLLEGRPRTPAALPWPDLLSMIPDRDAARVLTELFWLGATMQSPLRAAAYLPWIAR